MPSYRVTGSLGGRPIISCTGLDFSDVQIISRIDATPRPVINFFTYSVGSKPGFGLFLMKASDIFELLGPPNKLDQSTPSFTTTTTLNPFYYHVHTTRNRFPLYLIQVSEEDNSTNNGSTNTTTTPNPLTEDGIAFCVVTVEAVHPLKRLGVPSPLDLSSDSGDGDYLCAVEVVESSRLMCEIEATGFLPTFNWVCPVANKLGTLERPQYFLNSLQRIPFFKHTTTTVPPGVSTTCIPVEPFTCKPWSWEYIFHALHTFFPTCLGKEDYNSAPTEYPPDPSVVPRTLSEFWFPGITWERVDSYNFQFAIDDKLLPYFPSDIYYRIWQRASRVRYPSDGTVYATIIGTFPGSPCGSSYIAPLPVMSGWLDMPHQIRIGWEVTSNAFEYLVLLARYFGGLTVCYDPKIETFWLGDASQPDEFALEILERNKFRLLYHSNDCWGFNALLPERVEIEARHIRAVADPAYFEFPSVNINVYIGDYAYYRQISVNDLNYIPSSKKHLVSKYIFVTDESDRPYAENTCQPLAGNDCPDYYSFLNPFSSPCSSPDDRVGKGRCEYFINMACRYYDYLRFQWPSRLVYAGILHVPATQISHVVTWSENPSGGWQTEILVDKERFPAFVEDHIGWEATPRDTCCCPTSSTTPRPPITTTTLPPGLTTSSTTPDPCSDEVPCCWWNILERQANCVVIPAYQCEELVASGSYDGYINYSLRDCSESRVWCTTPDPQTTTTSNPAICCVDRYNLMDNNRAYAQCCVKSRVNIDWSSGSLIPLQQTINVKWTKTVTRPEILILKGADIVGEVGINVLVSSEESQTTVDVTEFLSLYYSALGAVEAELTFWVPNPQGLLPCDPGIGTGSMCAVATEIPLLNLIPSGIRQGFQDFGVWQFFVDRYGDQKCNIRNTVHYGCRLIPATRLAGSPFPATPLHYADTGIRLVSTIEIEDHIDRRRFVNGPAPVFLYCASILFTHAVRREFHIQPPDPSDPLDLTRYYQEICNACTRNEADNVFDIESGRTGYIVPANIVPPQVVPLVLNYTDDPDRYDVYSTECDKDNIELKSVLDVERWVCKDGTGISSWIQPFAVFSTLRHYNPGGMFLVYNEDYTFYKGILGWHFPGDQDTTISIEISVEDSDLIHKILFYGLADYSDLGYALIVDTPYTGTIERMSCSTSSDDSGGGGGGGGGDDSGGDSGDDGGDSSDGG